VIEHTCRHGAWPSTTPGSKAGSRAQAASALEEQLRALEQRLDQRLLEIERLLALIADAVLERR